MHGRKWENRGQFYQRTMKGVMRLDEDERETGEDSRRLAMHAEEDAGKVLEKLQKM